MGFIYKKGAEPPYQYDTDVLVAICDRCGKQCANSAEDDLEYATLKASWGYSSKRDGERDEAVLCENCYYYIVHETKIQFKTTFYD